MWVMNLVHIGTRAAIEWAAVTENVRFMLGRPCPPDVDPSGWWMSEKLDGVRAFWTGEKLVSRGGHPINAPDWFLKNLPPMAVDGELWAGRAQFQSADAALDGLESEVWKNINYMLFDAPHEPGGFEDRFGRLLEWDADTDRNHVTVLPQARCAGQAHLQDYFESVIAQRGEGVMLRQPGSAYEPRRSDAMLKLKPIDDTPATVIDHKPGKRYGSVVVQCADGREFSVSAKRDMNVEVGQSIVVRHNGVTENGIPKFPRLVRE